MLFDTSALVAILSATDVHHADCIAELRKMVGPRVTTWPVITEAHYLLRREPKAQEKLLDIVSSRTVLAHALDASFLNWMKPFVNRYQDQEVQIADASLVWLAEKLKTNAVFTLDRRDFSTFQIHRGYASEAFAIIPELG
ncbi:type II toxin-antitoxin system VapC family toxin [Rubripirellula lacrimiformis]|uniref:type II toxin-antitoxin system VapC family toxin n=1 Tax=Rubripirellula lacrimiformis TaxID=1930273 RepID=UPI001FE4C3EB|nr:PIN domain-containing protein [Rubripirellula lacrimiformis]